MSPGRGAGPGTLGGALLRQCKACITHSCTGYPKPLPVLGEPQLPVHEVLLRKSLHGAHRAGESRAGLRTPESRAPRMNPPSTAPPSAASASAGPGPSPQGMGIPCTRPTEFSGREEGAVRVGLFGWGEAAEGSQLAAISAALGPVWLPG